MHPRLAINVQSAPTVTNEYTIFAIIFIVVVVVSTPFCATVVVTSGNIVATRLRSNRAYSPRLSPPTTRRIKKIR